MPINIYDLVKSTTVIGDDTIKNKTSENTTVEKKAEPEYNGWWKKSSNGKKRVMLCGTYPIGTSNGYSKVVLQSVQILSSILKTFFTYN
jgi:hypothetical protein